MKVICFLRSIWRSVYCGASVSGHDYHETDDVTPPNVQVLTCATCGHASVGWSWHGMPSVEPLKQVLGEAERYVRAYKCGCDPGRTKEEASALLGRIGAILDDVQSVAQSEPQTCTNPHTPCPSSYVEWCEWADKMERTHVQEKCPVCGKWAIWREITSSRQNSGT